MNRIYVDYHAECHVTREADPNSAYDRDSTATSYSIFGLSRTQGFGASLDVGFEVKPNTSYYLLYYIESTGDSFGHDEGAHIEFVGLYRDYTAAKEAEEILNKTARDGQTNAKIMLDTGDGYREHSEYLSSVHDYFGSFDGAEVQTVELR